MSAPGATAPFAVGKIPPDMSERKPVECWLTDMDGVLVREEDAIPGASDFVAALRAAGRAFLVLTNNPM